MVIDDLKFENISAPEILKTLQMIKVKICSKNVEHKASSSNKCLGRVLSLLRFCTTWRTGRLDTGKTSMAEIHY